MRHLVRPLTATDLPGLLAVQRACYGEAYIESAAVVARRAASPAQCALVLERAGQLCAYLAAYDSVVGHVTPLHGDFAASDAPDTLYLHDLAVLPALAGQGLAQALLAPVWRDAVARGLTRSALVAVQGSKRYWERHGYRVHALRDEMQQQRLAAYGNDAAYMLRTLA
ncbi:MAG: GNAT family N-acetyltransferase [Simplicispira suum]|uniref:GNAT family N-acetyltransferase n=1 Tax=Simplicispira suum TaxID=2109915 RepID=UPI001C6D1564|nr:GNAT family N-acetyltransferase [Simplicispira suum]MBW7832333.1 GNAT family N-acetyltransferase [Simplicispira suum]